MEQDIRWKQRFSNYVIALQKLTQALEYISNHFLATDESVDNSDSDYVLDEIVREGLIQRFENTHELAWNVMKDYAAYQGNPNVHGSRDVIREGFNLQLIADGNIWMDMIGSRNKTSHTYNKETAHEIYDKIMDAYYPAFLAFRDTMEAKRSGEQKRHFNGEFRLAKRRNRQDQNSICKIQ